MILYEFTITDSFCKTMTWILEEAKKIAEEAKEFEFICSEGKEEWDIKSVEMEGLPVAKDETIVYKFIVYGNLIKVNYDH